MAVELQVGAVVFGSKFGVTNIAKADQGAVSIGLDNDVLELCGIGEPADGANANLECLSAANRRLADLAGGNFDVLFAERIDRVGGSQSAAGHAFGIEPQAHRISPLAEDE